MPSSRKESLEDYYLCKSVLVVIFLGFVVSIDAALEGSSWAFSFSIKVYVEKGYCRVVINLKISEAKVFLTRFWVVITLV